MSHRWNGTWVQGETAPGFAAALGLACVGQVGVSRGFLDQQAARKEYELQTHTVPPAPLLNWDELVSWGHAESCLAAGTSCNWEGARSIPSCSPKG